MTAPRVEPVREETHTRRGVVASPTGYMVRLADGTLYRHGDGVAQFDRFETAAAVVGFLSAPEPEVAP
jgi:hypothetical protein